MSHSRLTNPQADTDYVAWHDRHTTILRWTCGAHFAGAVAHGACAAATTVWARMDAHVMLVLPCAHPLPTANDTGYGFRLSYEDAFRWYPGWAIFAFFVLSCSLHTFCFCSAAVGLRGRSSWYFWSLFRCCTPSRWAEYFFSASLMIANFATITAIRDVRYLLAVTALMATTQLFGLAGELQSMWLIESTHGKMRRWRTDSKLRLAPWLAGCFPYCTCLGVLLWISVDNVRTLGVDNPDFVIGLLASQMALFSCFGITQAWNVLDRHGPENYVWGEFSYVVLSFTAKLVFGVVTIQQALAEGARYDAEIGFRFG